MKKVFILFGITIFTLGIFIFLNTKNRRANYSELEGRWHSLDVIKVIKDYDEKPIYANPEIVEYYLDLKKDGSYILYYNDVSEKDKSTYRIDNNIYEEGTFSFDTKDKNVIHFNPIKNGYIWTCELNDNVLEKCNNHATTFVNESNNIEKSDRMSKINIKINNQDYILNLEDNQTTRELINILPETFTMNELNGNEKYVYLDVTFTTNSYNPERINAGDVMLYGNNCLVIFYKSFNTSYSYTKIGHIDNLPDLGSSNIEVTIG